jgi:hypothetical protein
MLKRIGIGVLFAAILGCGSNAPPRPANGVAPANSSTTLAEARTGFKTKLARKHSAGHPAPTPPANVFQLIKYEAPVGKLSAYVTPDPKDGKKHPAIIWITGGDCNTIDDLWSPAPPQNDQTAAQYRQAGIIMMFPSLRGGNDNPGFQEGFFGEVDDILAAADYLAKQPYVDPARIYLGGHSTGGTMVLIVSELSDRFRAVFSFGPADDVRGYPNEFTPFDRTNPREGELRSPLFWLGSIKSPTFVIEGDSPEANISALRVMSQKSTNPKVVFLPVRRASHFNLLAPANRLIAEKILRDDGPTCQLTLTEDEVNKVAGK